MRAENGTMRLIDLVIHSIGIAPALYQSIPPRSVMKKFGDRLSLTNASPIRIRMCVLIPAKDERLGIGKTVSSVLAAGAPPDDVYVVDDGSSDGTGEIARSHSVNVLRNE